MIIENIITQERISLPELEFVCNEKFSLRMSLLSTSSDWPCGVGCGWRCWQISPQRLQWWCRPRWWGRSGWWGGAREWCEVKCRLRSPERGVYRWIWRWSGWCRLCLIWEVERACSGISASVPGPSVPVWGGSTNYLAQKINE